jgi:Protein of unknown function (DUF1464)
MAICVGVDYAHEHWKVCVAENGVIVECVAFEYEAGLLTYLERLCSWYPEIILMLATSLETPFTPLHIFLAQHSSVGRSDYAIAQTLALSRKFLLSVSELSCHSHVLPSVKFLPYVPAYRLLMRPRMGSARMVCLAVLLLYHMRQREATWDELNFIFLKLEQGAYHLLVVKNGQIVDGTGEWTVIRATGEEIEESFYQQALLEQLAYDLAALMAIHHSEDIVLLEDPVVGATRYQDAIIEHFADYYQFFLYPQEETESHGFEVARGATIIAEGTHHPGLAADLIQRLFPMLA